MLSLPINHVHRKPQNRKEYCAFFSVTTKTFNQKCILSLRSTGDFISVDVWLYCLRNEFSMCRRSQIKWALPILRQSSQQVLMSFNSLTAMIELQLIRHKHRSSLHPFQSDASSENNPLNIRMGTKVTHNLWVFEEKIVHHSACLEMMPRAIIRKCQRLCYLIDIYRNWISDKNVVLTHETSTFGSDRKSGWRCKMDIALLLLSLEQTSLVIMIQSINSFT